MLVITNAQAGTSDAERLEEALEILRTRCSVDVAATSNPGELDGVLQRAGSRPIVVAGGDGSLHAVVQALHRRGELAGKTLALLPLGTGNDFARGARIPLELPEAARVVLDGEARPVDMLVDETGAVVVNNVHVGMGALAARRGKRWKDRLGSVGVGKVNLGKLGYPIGTLMSALRPPYLKLRVEVDGVEVNPYSRPVLMVAVGNGTSVGGGARLTPDADLEDGAADVVVSRAVSPLAKAGYVIDLARRRHTERDDVLELRGRRVRVTGEEFWVSADGELYGPERAREWRLLTSAFRMVLPS